MALLAEYVQKRGSQCCVISHTSGKKLGCYGSEDKARKRLGQIQMFKHMKESGSNGSNVLEMWDRTHGPQLERAKV
jgi:hypothetical protein